MFLIGINLHLLARDTLRWHCTVCDMNINYHAPNFLPEKCTISHTFQFVLSTCTARFLCMLTTAVQLVMNFF